jgi:N-acetylated-alpha-linked acidic dipeptidase
MTLVPHIAGSSNNQGVGEQIKALFSQYGLPQTWTETYPVTLSYPVRRSVSVKNAQGTYEASLFEPIVNDGTEQPENVVPTYHGYAPSGFAEGELVFVNYGTASDYAYLDSVPISLTGKIVLARYEHGFRGDKCALAQQRGAIGCLIYSDPSDDGYLLGKTYPDGPFRPVDGVQRGSVWSGSGDPTTPGWPSTPKSPRLTLEEASDASNRDVSFPLLTIPTQPLSAADAKPFLEKLGGIPWPGLNATAYLPGGYHVGPGPAVVTMNITNSFEVRNIQNHFGKIPGSIEPDRIILLGVHHDAWTYGGADPMSGSVAMLEVVRAYGQMYKAGWRPRRSIVFATWDAEEYALVGSTEFAELHFQELTNRLVAYLNLDIAVSGTGAFYTSGTPNFVSIVQKATKLVPSPADKKSTVYDLWKVLGTLPEAGVPEMGQLGAGSDYAVFLQHLGVSSLSVQFVDPTRGTYGQYHSRYDTFNFMKSFVDPTWTWHTSLAKVLGLVGKALGDSYILPYDFVQYASYLSRGVNSLANQIMSKAPASVSFANLQQSQFKFAEAADAVQAEINKLASTHNPDPIALRSLNDRLFLTERAFINYQGLPGQPWLRHMIYAPSNTDSYAGAMFPTIVNAAAGSHPNWQEVQNQINLCSIFVDAATEVLSGGKNSML